MLLQVIFVTTVVVGHLLTQEGKIMRIAKKNRGTLIQDITRSIRVKYADVHTRDYYGAAMMFVYTCAHNNVCVKRPMQSSQQRIIA